MASHNQVAHAWAHQTGRQTKGHNMFYVGDTIYSYGYHYAIARLITMTSGECVVLMNSNGYSVSTNKHKSIVSRAVSHLTIIEVPYVLATNAEACQANFEYLVKSAADWVAKARRARLYGDSYLSRALGFIRDANEYNRLFALGFSTVTLEGLSGFTEEIAEKARMTLLARARQREEEEAARHAREAVKREAWLAGESNGFYGRDRAGGAYGRIVGDKLQTSLGADVPLSHAIRVFRFVKLCRERKEGWRRNGKTIRVGHFHVDSVDAHGNFMAGCHSFNWPEVERLARLAGVYDNKCSSEALEASEHA